MELTLADTPKIAIEMFEAGETSKRVAERLRVKGDVALAMKKAWLDSKAPKKTKAAKEPKA